MPSKKVKLNMECATMWAQAFATNRTLVHLDISHN
jgi:hypothetical protein